MAVIISLQLTYPLVFENKLYDPPLLRRYDAETSDDW
jgi:hypothetical protein